jgi:hypothetical protein
MSKLAPSRIVELNLLPRAERPGEVAPIALVFAAAVIVSIAALVPLSLQARAARSDADAMQARAAAAEAGLHDVQVDLARQLALRAEIDKSKADLDAVTAVRAQMQGGTRPLHEDFIWLYGLGFLTNGMKITAVTGTASGFRVDGAAPGPLDAIAYAEKLTTDGGFPAARVSAFTPAAKNGGQFTVEVTR